MFTILCCIFHPVFTMLFHLIALHCNTSSQITVKTLNHHILSFIHLVVCLTTVPKPLPKQAVRIVWSRASSFKWEYPLLSLRSSSSFLRFLPHLPDTCILPFIFPSITHCGRQFLHKMLPIQLAFHLLISCRIFLFISHMISPTDLFHPSPGPHFETFHVFMIYCQKHTSFSTI